MTNQVTCSVHKDVKAETICMKHYDFQCVSCVIKDAQSKDCDIVELQSSQGEREQCVIKFSVSNQKATHLQDLNATYISKLNDLKCKLLKEVDDHHKKLASRLEEIVKSSEESVEKQAGIIQKKIFNENDALDRCKDDIETNLKTLSKEDANLNESLKILNDINARIDQVAKKPDSEISGSFEPNENIRDNMTMLGQVYIKLQNRYEELAKTTKSQKQDASSIENIERAQNDTPMPNVEDGESANDQRSWFCNLFKRRSRSNKYEDVKIDETNTTQPHYETIVIEEQPQQQQQQQQMQAQQQQQLQLMNFREGRVKIPNLKSDSSIPASKCEQLIHMGGNYFGLLSTSLSTVFITALPHGPSIRKNIPGPLSRITSVGHKAIAILTTKESTQINVFGLEENKLNISGSNILTETITGISGFNFDVRSSTYVISCPTRCVVLGKSCKVIKTFSIPQTNCEDPSSIRSVYDFKSEQIIYLDPVEKTLTAFSCKKDFGEPAWNKVISDENFAPRSMCLYKDVVCVASNSSVSVFSRKDGAHVKNIETCSILSDCLAVCGVNGLLFWTSDSDEQELSESIGIVKL